jgi:hypothetical protein
MGEQSRRAVDLEPERRVAKRPRSAAQRAEIAPTQARPDDTPGPDEAEERQTARQAPSGASPGESAESDSIG